MQALVFLPDEPVALAGLLPQAWLVENAYVAAAVFDQPGRLKLTRSLANALATRPEHRGHRLVHRHELARAGIVVYGEQPARHALLYVVVLAAGHRLTDHRKKRPRVAQKQPLERAAETHFFPQVFRLHPHRPARELHNRLVGGDDTAQEDIDPHDSFAADDADLNGTPIVVVSTMAMTASSGKYTSSIF
jgi:hypothetical protein